METASELKPNLARQTVVSQYLTFTLGNEEYGVDILRVQEIRGWQDVMYQHEYRSRNDVARFGDL